MSSQGPSRDERVGALDNELAQVSTLSVLWSQTVADHAGISSTDLESLDILRRHGPMTAGRLAELTGLSTGGAVTALIDRLERQGYALRETDQADRRRVLVRMLPDRAERELAPLYAPLAQAMNHLISRYSDAEVEVILDFLSRANAIVLKQITELRGKATERPMAPASKRE